MVFYSSFFFSFFIPEVISAVTYPIAEYFFTDTRVMAPGCQRTSRISKILVTYLTWCKKPQKMQFFTFFSLGDLTFSFTAQTRFELGAIWKQIYHLRWITFLKYNNGYCAVRSSPDHRVESLIEFRKVVFSFNGDVMVIAHCFAAYDFLRRRRQIWFRSRSVTRHAIVTM